MNYRQALNYAMKTKHTRTHEDIIMGEACCSFTICQMRWDRNRQNFKLEKPA